MNNRRLMNWHVRFFSTRNGIITIIAESTVSTAFLRPKACYWPWMIHVNISPMHLACPIYQVMRRRLTGLSYVYSCASRKWKCRTIRRSIQCTEISFESRGRLTGFQSYLSIYDPDDPSFEQQPSSQGLRVGESRWYQLSNGRCRVSCIAHAM